MTRAAGAPPAAHRGPAKLTARVAARVAGLPPWATVLVGVLAWAAALAAIEPIVHGYLTNPPDQRLVDLNVYRTGGLSVLQGQPLYSVLTQPPQLLPFTYPPAAAIFAVPLALMSWPAAQLVWVAFVYVPLAVIVGYAFRPLLHRAGPLRPVAFAAIFCACAYLFPMQDEMRFGQADAVLAAMFVADCAAVRPRWPRGALIGLATAIKLVPGMFIIYLLVSGRHNAARTAVLAAVAWTAGAFLLLPRDSVTYWTSAIFDSGRLGNNAGTENQSLRGLLLRFFLPGHAPGVVWVVIALAVAVPGFALAGRLSREHYEMAGIAVTAMLLVLISPVAWIHYFLMVIIAIGVIAGDGRAGPAGPDGRRDGRLLRADHSLVGPLAAVRSGGAPAAQPGHRRRLRDRGRGPHHHHRADAEDRCGPRPARKRDRAGRSGRGRHHPG